MAKREKKQKSESDMTITKEQMRKLIRAERRRRDIEQGTYIKTGSGAHRTSKSDVAENISNTVSPEELEGLFEEYCEEYEEYEES